MLGLVLGLAIGMAIGVVASLFVRREWLIGGWLRGEVKGLREDIEQARLEVRTMNALQSSDMLDGVENEDVEIASNLDRMNLLLDQLNGLLKGRGEPAERRKVFFREEEPPLDVPLDFASPDELRKFENMPPLSREEIESTDWEYLFNRIRTDDVD